MQEQLIKLPKVELHLHLDGSVEVNTISNITKEKIEVLEEKMVTKENCKDLSEYLTKFQVPIECMQTKENLTLISNELIKYLERQNIIYAEIRFAPIHHTKKGLTMKEVVDAVLKGLKSNNNIDKLDNTINPSVIAHEYDITNIS